MNHWIQLYDDDEWNDIRKFAELRFDLIEARNSHEEWARRAEDEALNRLRLFVNQL